MRKLNTRPEDMPLDIPKVYEKASLFSPEMREMCGSALTYVVEASGGVASLGRIHDLLFLMQQHFALAFSEPFILLPFEVWKQGPVQRDLFVDMCTDMALTSDYLHRRWTPEGPVFTAAGPYSETRPRCLSLSRQHQADEFMKEIDAAEARDRDIHLLATGHGSCWRKAADRAGLLPAFAKGAAVCSHATIDFKEYMEDPAAAEAYQEWFDDKENWALLGL